MEPRDFANRLCVQGTNGLGTRRKIYLEPVPQYHGFARQLEAFPPDGYEVMVPQTVPQRAYKSIYRWGLGRQLMATADLILPPGLLKAAMNRWSSPPKDALLTYSTDQLVFRPEPWVVEVEYASLLLGADVRHMRRFRGVLEGALASPFCRKIRCWSEAGRRSLLADLDSRGFEHKIEVVHYAVAPKAFEKQYRNEKIRLFFVGSGTSKAGFDARGGREALEVFALLRRDYGNLELVVRAEVPDPVKAHYAGVEGLRFLTNFASREMLDQEYRLADIFVLPCHNTSSPMVILEAMSFELPVVTIDAWANAEYVEDGKTGFLAPRSERLRYYYRDTHQPNWGTPQFRRAIRTPDSRVVRELAKKIRLLIDDPDLRRRMGRAARWEIENGRFSLATMNRKLVKIFDESIDCQADAQSESQIARMRVLACG